jgi:hypothetical protein
MERHVAERAFPGNATNVVARNVGAVGINNCGSRRRAGVHGDRPGTPAEPRVLSHRAAGKLRRSAAGSSTSPPGKREFVHAGRALPLQPGCAALPTLRSRNTSRGRSRMISTPPGPLTFVDLFRPPMEAGGRADEIGPLLSAAQRELRILHVLDGGSAGATQWSAVSGPGARCSAGCSSGEQEAGRADGHGRQSQLTLMVSSFARARARALVGLAPARRGEPPPQNTVVAR